MTEQQARRSRPKARGIVELYSRRIRVYRAAAALLGEIVRVVYVSQETLLRYARDTDEAIFLFDDVVAEYLFKLYQEAVRLQYLGKTQERLPVGPELSAKAEEQYQLLKWFSAQFGELRSRVVPFLRA
jgi:undecaprenyl pyrophosphate synthase